ncbi:M23 family metallopeptidase [Rossellomorea vietnamensis]|uniref:M23 family metallopeptidase n=1 Tax=Rossellomorea vietnamensis TaxID=218284 RepID=A0A5D4NMV0_9BACI|nr:M23 family metallopeptidase [Rossellomorea vietnamensis]TYS14262.1 M23 family metallopeptidase [Rossellomorea vietnamensis]
MFIYPCKGRLTSPFGKDILQGAVRWHNGIDLAQGGTVEIVAAADGVVHRSYRSSSYGEVIFLLHNIGGQEYETVYAHLKSGSRRVEEGARVKQGQVLGVMGNTGMSTGQHLHFELHKGKWNSNKSNAVDPLLYLGKDLDGDKYLNLHKHMKEWNHYATDVQPVTENAHKVPLKPAKFGGLSYKIEGNPYPNVYTIKTGQFGYQNIYAPRDKDSSITSSPVYR